MYDPDVKTRVTPLEELRPPRQGTDCLVVIHSCDTRQLGRRYMLECELLSVGRGQENTLVLHNDSVSRRHCRLEKRNSGWYLCDLDSTNGTYVNDELVKEYQLRRGDQIKIGDTILKYLSGSDVETQYHEAIHEIAIRDALTSTHNKSYLLESLEREVPRALWYHRPLSVVLFDIDRFKNINDTYGRETGDYILKEIAALVKGRLRPDDVFGRFGGAEFCAILPNQGGVDAGEVATGIQRLVEERTFLFEGETLATTVSAGVVELRPDQDATSLLKAAGEVLDEARRGGRNRIAVAGLGGLPARRWLAEPILIRRALANERFDGLLVFELGNESQILEAGGTEGLASEFRALEDLVEQEVPEEDLLGSRKDRYVLVASTTAASMVDEVPRVWAEARSSETHPAPPLRTAQLSRAELSEFGERAVDQLIARLVRRDPNQALESTVKGALPFPLVAPLTLIDAGTSALPRLKARAYAIEVQMIFAAAVGFAIVAAHDAPPELLAALADVRGRPLSMGSWVQFVRLFAESVDAEQRHPAARWLRGLLGSKRHRKRTSLTTLEALVGRRNDLIGHGIPRPDEAYAEAEAAFRQATEDMIEAAAPLMHVSLVSVASSEVLDETDGFAYDLRIHEGPSELFPLRREVLSYRLSKGFAYLLAPGHDPLNLAPILFSAVCPTCQRVELMMATAIDLSGDESVVKGRGITTGHETTIPAPKGGQYRAYVDAIRRRGPSAERVP